MLAFSPAAVAMWLELIGEMILKRLRILCLSTGLAFVLLHFAQESFAQKRGGDKPSIPLDHFYAEPENRNAFRVFLSKFHFSFSTGYGRTFYSQDLSDFAILQQQDSLPLIFGKDFSIAGGNISSGYNYWFNNLQGRSNINYNPSTDFIVSADSAELKFEAPGMSIPLNFSIHFEFDRYRVGGGFTLEYHRPGTFRPTVYGDQISAYEPDFGSAFFKKYYVMLGARVYRYYEYSLSVDANIGAINLTNNFDKSIIQKGMYVNLGATIERDLSEYFRVFVKPSFDIKSFTLNVPETDLSIHQSMNAFYVSFGVTFRIPELPRCFLKQCTTQVNHQHGNREYRSRMHPFYKKQNPHHGENYPRLIKYKGKNKKKLHPY